MNMHRLARAPYLLALLLTIVGIFWTAPSTAQQGQDFFTITACRVYDSRGGGGPLDQGVTYTVPVAGTCGVPANAKSVSLNVTILGASGSGLLKVYPAGAPQPFPHTFNFRPGRTIAHFGLVPLGTGGAVSFITSMDPPSPGKYQVVIDVTGYFFDGPPTAVDDNYETEKDTPLIVAAADGVTDNDTLNGGSIVSYGATTGAEQTTIGASTPTSQGGTVALNADGSFTYTPPTGAVEINDTFKYVLQNLSGSSTATVTIGVGKIAQTITFTSTAPTDASVGGPTYTVTATATSGLPVTFTIDPSAASVCTIAGSTVSFIGVGTCVINADQAGDTSYNPAPQVQQSFPVVKGDQTITFTSTAPTDAKVGGPTYNVTATASSGLTVTFTIDATAASVCSIAGSTVSFLSVGTCVINANQAGDANWNPAPQVQQSFPVAKGDQTITFTSTAPSDATVNGPTYNVTATASSGLPVTFAIDASAASVCSIAGSTVSFIAAGTCVINADQAGDANYNPAPQAQQSFAVSLASQTISFTSTAPTDAKVNGPTYTVTATATSGLTVTFTIDASAASVCSIAGSTVSFIGAGTCVINANQAGDSSYAAAPQEQQSFPVVKNDQTITFTSAAPSNAQVAGPTYNVTATADSGLTVTFTIDASASSVCSIAGSTVSFLSVGTCVINANQAGDANYNPAPQVQQSFAVAQGDQSITFTSTAPPGAQVAGPTYTVTATASSGLPVTFTIDGSAASVCTIAGSTVSFIGAGTCVINANQAGNANYNAAPQAQQSFPVAKGNQTITFTSTPPAGATAGGPTYTVTANATSGLAVIFSIDASASSVCTIAGSTVSFIGGGTCVINANQPGDANWNAAPQAQQSFSVVKQDQTITFTSAAPANAMVAGPTYTVTATATSTLPVTFTIDASASTVCSIAGSTVSFIGAGTCVINANQAGNAIYNPAPQVQQSFLVVKQDQTITFTSTPPALATIGGPTYTVTATATSGLPVAFTIDASASTVCTIAGSTVSFIGGGTCVINANQAGNTTYNPAPQVQQSFPVNFPPQLVTTPGFPKELFDTIGNTAFEFKAAQALSPSVFVSGNLRANFTDSDGPSPLSVLAAAGCSDPTAPYDCPTTNGGMVSLASNGEFTFTPEAGDTETSDSFTYRITDGAYTISRTVTLNRRERVWYVKNDDSPEAPAFDNGTSVDPFNTLAAAQTASSLNDYIFVYYGDGTTTGQNQGIALKNGQHLIGQFSGLTVNFNPAITFNGTAGTTSVTLLAQPSPTFCSGNPCRPLLDDTLAGAPEGVGAVDVIPAQIIGLNLAGNVNAIDWNTAAAVSGTGTLAILDNVVRSAGADGVDINLAGTGAVNLAFSNNSLTAGGIGLDIQETGTGSLTITAFSSNAVGSSNGGTGININNATFDATPTGSFNTVSGGTTVVGASGDGVGGAGMVLTNVQGDLSFTDLDIFADNGAGLQASSGAAYTGSAGLRIVVGAGVGIIEATGGPAVIINTATIDLQLSSLKSTNTASTGVSLVNVSDGGSTNAVFSAGSGSSITTTAGAAGPAFNVSGGNAKITYGGTITNNGTGGRAVSITSWSGDDAVPGDDLLLSGAIDENGAGILVNGNGGSRSITFSGGMDIDTTTGEGFAATSNTNTGGLHITGTNTIDTVSATALRVTNTTVGNSNLNFQRISSGNSTAAADPANGIVLNTTGSLGSLIVTGTGAADSGGVIQNTTGHGVSLTSTLSPSFTRMKIQNTAGSGVEGTQVTNFTFVNGTIDNSGTGGGADDSNLAFNEQATGTENNLSGTVTITDNTLTNARWHGIMIQNFNGTIADAIITGNTITSSTSAATSLGYGINLQILGSATTVSNLTKATISGNTVTNFPSAGGIQVQGGNSNAAGPVGILGVAGSGADIISIVNNQVRGQSAANRMATSAILYTVSGKGQGNVDVSSNGTLANPIGNNTGTTIGVGANGNTTLTATTNNNFVEANHPGTTGDSGISGGVGVTFGVTDVADMTWTINGNTIRNVDGNGILAVARGTNGVLKVKIQNNNVEAPQAGVRPGIRVDAGNTTAGTDNDVCLNISGNISAGSGGSQGIGLRKQGTSTTVHAFGVNGMAATSSPGVETYVNGLNPAGNSSLLISATSGFSNCSLP